MRERRFIDDNYLDYDGYTNAKRIGGIIGGSEAADVTVESCVNSGNIFSHTGCRAGGFVGHFKGESSPDAPTPESSSATSLRRRRITAAETARVGRQATATSRSPAAPVAERSASGYFKSNPEGAPDATIYNAYGYQNSSISTLLTTNKMKTMKRLTNILLSVLMMVSAFTGCGFDEDPFQNRLNDIKNRIAALQSRIDEANKQVETLGMLHLGNVVTSIDKNSDGAMC